jgi:hypothetical protein
MDIVTRCGLAEDDGVKGLSSQFGRDCFESFSGDPPELKDEF